VAAEGLAGVSATTGPAAGARPTAGGRKRADRDRGRRGRRGAGPQGEELGADPVQPAPELSELGRERGERVRARGCSTICHAGEHDRADAAPDQ
jgi:hypothetical protein